MEVKILIEINGRPREMFGTDHQRRTFYVDQLEAIHVEDNNYVLVIDPEKAREFTNWEALEELPVEAKEKVLEVAYYITKASEVQAIANRVRNLEYSYRWKWEQYANQVIQILDSLVLKNEFLILAHTAHNHAKWHIHNCLQSEGSTIRGLPSKVNSKDHFNFEVSRNRLANDIEKVVDFLLGGKLKVLNIE